MLRYEDVLTDFSRLISVDSTEELLTAFGRVVADAGGSGFAVAYMPGERDIVSTHHAGLHGWCEHFEAEHFVRDCPITRRLLQSNLPFSWAEVRSKLTDPKQIAVLDAASEHGIVDGLIVPVRTHEGMKGDVFIAIDARQLEDQPRMWLTMAALSFHARLLTLQAADDADNVAISSREHEVLLWLAQGKSAEDVATILGISAATVMFHYRNVARQLGTLNRTHTVVEAVRRGALKLRYA